MMPSAVLAGRTIESKGTRLPFMFGLAVIGLGFVEMLLTWQPGAALPWVVLAYVLIGIGIGFASTAAMRSLSMSLPVSKAGMSSGSADLTKDLGGAVFQALLGTLLAIAYSDYFAKAFASLPPEQSQALGQRAAQEIASSYEGAEAVAATLPGADSAQLIAAAQQAFTEGKAAAIGLAIVSVVIGIVLVWWRFPRAAEERQIFADVAGESGPAASG